MAHSGRFSDRIATRSPRWIPIAVSPYRTRRILSINVRWEIGVYCSPTRTTIASGLSYFSTASNSRWLSVPGCGRGPPRAYIGVAAFRPDDADVEAATAPEFATIEGSESWLCPTWERHRPFWLELLR